MINVYCDSNFWYTVHSWLTSKTNHEYCFIITPLIAEEISKSPKLLDEVRKAQVQQAAKNALTFGKPLSVDLSPFEVIIKVAHSNYSRRQNSNQNRVSSSSSKTIQEYKSSLIEPTKALHEWALKLKSEECNNKEQRHKLRVDTSFTIAKEWLSYWTAGFIKNLGTPSDNINWTEFDFSRIEFFMHVLDRYMKELICGSFQPKPNDWVDILNTIYVTPQDKYCTCDKLILEKVKLPESIKEKYLLNPSGLCS